jgi:hypothetical protein
MQLRLRRLLMFYIKGIVSRDLHVCFLVSIERAEVPTSYGTVRLLLKFRYQFVFDILTCFAVGVGAGAASKFFLEPNPCKNHAAAQCWDPDPVGSEFLAESTSVNFYQILSWIQIQPHS